MSPQVPEKPGLDGLEQKWGARWEADGTFRFDHSAARDQIYSIDTPPPTVSGSLHVGSVFGYVQQDTIARYRRMAGATVFYPMGWDDNGLPTERRVENYFGVRCDASLPYEPDFQLPEKPDPKRKLPISRPNFVELCHRLTAEDEKAFEAVWRYLGLSVDWSLTYATIGERSQRTSQIAFVRNLATGDAYQAEAPTLWDVTFQTAVAQAELGDREVPGAYHRIRFAGPDHQDIHIETTRPELIPACVALVAHPDDARFRDRFGTTVRTPLFGVEVPVLAHELADPAKGSGIAMICTFGDITDVVWWRELGLPIRSIVRRNGRIQDDPPHGVPDNDAWRLLAGTTVSQAQAVVVDLLRASGDLLGEPRPVNHAVKFYEKGDRPLEIVTSRQWFIRVLDHRDDLLRLGQELRWHPANMRARYDSWVQGLNSDWLISRQRFFGVPIPLWYRLDDDGLPLHDEPVVPAEDRLPIDPSTDVPEGFSESERGVPGGFASDPDIMDTWATSSLTPQIACGWADDPELFERTFPMNRVGLGSDEAITKVSELGSVSKKHLKSKVKMVATQVFAGSIGEAHSSDADLANCMMLRTTYSSPPRTLQLGTVVQASSEEYWVCVQPMCDSVRLKSEIRAFPFLRLRVSDQAKFQFVVTDATGIERFLVLTKNPRDVVVARFKPLTGKSVIEAVQAGDAYVFRDTGNKRLRWVAQLKPEFAQKVAVDLANEFAQVAVDEAELRRLSLP